MIIRKVKSKLKLPSNIFTSPKFKVILTVQLFTSSTFTFRIWFSSVKTTGIIQFKVTRVMFT
jgi:hypothetical protein